MGKQRQEIHQCMLLAGSHHAHDTMKGFVVGFTHILATFTRLLKRFERWRTPEHYTPQRPEPTPSASLDLELGAQCSVVVSLDLQPQLVVPVGASGPN